MYNNAKHSLERDDDLRVVPPRSLMIALSIAVSQACTNTINMPITTPELSTIPYEGGDQAVGMSFVDMVGVSHQVVSVSQGGLPYELDVVYNKKPLNSQFFFDNLKAELTARNLNLAVIENSDYSLRLNDFSILHHRYSGFGAGYSPIVTLSTVSADLETPDGTHRITSFIRRAKVPWWSMDEVVEACFNQPIEILVRETAAKLNRALFDNSLGDETVQTLISKINQKPDKETYLDVLELGYSNNPAAIPALHELTSHEGEYIRQAAITGLGILGATEHLELLTGIYRNAKSWADRGTALKAIGDLGTPAAMEVLSEAKSVWRQRTGNEAAWNLRILGLYLDQ